MIRRLAVLGLAAGLWLWAPGSAGADVTLQVTSLQGSRDIDFGNARSLGSEGELESDVVIRQVRITITSTSSNRYQVFQRINEPWRALSGEDLPMENVQFFISEAAAGGTVRFPNPTPMSVGEQEIFLSSDNPGSSEEFLITYTIQVPPGQQTGDYRTTLSFRVVSQ